MNRSKLVAPTLLITSIFACLYAETFQQVELVSPYISHEFKVQASEVVSMEAGQNDLANPAIPLTPKDKVVSYIEEVFGEHAEEAKIVAKCESKFDHGVTGDTHIMSFDQKYQEMIGDSVGVFQIRTGGTERSGKIWNRARANNMTADEFRTYLKDYKNNVNYAKTIFDRQGWSPWTCKKDLVTSK